MTLHVVPGAVMDGSFESAPTQYDKTGISPWSYGNADDSQNFGRGFRQGAEYRSARNQSDSVVSGEYAAMLGVQGSDTITTLNERNIPVTPGRVYRVGFWATLGADAMGAGAAWSQYSTTVLSGSATATSVSGGRVHYTGTSRVPSDADPTGALRVSISQPGLASSAHTYVDSVTLAGTSSAR